MNGHALDAGGPRFAIVGIGCRLPGSANDHRAFWRNLADGRRCVAGGRGCIDGLDEFDPAFFGIGAREADAMDPQQRKLLEVAWEALEDAGQRPAELAGQRVGVFIGASAADYQILQFADPGFAQITEHTATGTAMGMVAGRIAACFDFRGPALAIDTAGSSSLVAVHLACRSLATGESSLALAGGVALDLAPQYAIAEARRGWLSPDGRSRPFDAAANGRVRAEGAGVVVIKRLAEAQRDGDPIHAVILASGVAHDGRGGIAGSGGGAQIAVIRQVCQDAGLSPGSLQYVEADGAATPAGDAIELAALGAVLADGREPGAACWVGSVKSNLGHAGAAAGIAGLIKVALCLKHRQIAPHVDLDQPVRSGIQIPTQLIAWPPHVGPACAGVHAIGLGAHAHVVLEEPPVDRRPAAQARPGDNHLPLTAGDPSALPAMAAALAGELASDQGRAPAVSAIGYTLARRRQHLDARLSFVYSSPAELAELVARYLAGEASPRIVAGRRLTGRRRLAWVFTGTGAEWWAMGRGLLAAEPVFRAVIERCDHEIARLARWSLLDELSAGEADSNMAEPCLAQLASFALQIGLAALWRSLGVRPDAIVGHGAGELAAFHEAGVYGLEDAIQIAIHRSRLLHTRIGSGAMLAVGLSEAAAEARIAAIAGIAGQVAIAAVDGPRSVALSGDRDALDELRAQLAADEVAAQWVPGAIAYHSRAMDRIRDELMAALADLRPRPAVLPLHLTAAEGTAGGPELDAAYWWRNVREPVRFGAAIDRMIDAGCGVFLELGPHPVLGGAIADCLAARGIEGRVVASLRRGEDEPCQIMASLAALHAAGLDIAWNELYPVGRAVALPAYPWKRDRHWTEPAAAQVRPGPRDVHAASGEPLGAVTGVPAAVPDAEVAGSTLDRCLDDVAWVELPALPEPGEAAAGEPWIVLADMHGVGAALARQLDGQPARQIDAPSARVWLVRPGSRFALDREQRAATIDPGSVADAGALIAAIAQRHPGRPCRIVHLWSLDTPALAGTTAAQLRDAAAHATYSLVVLAQALRASGLTGELSIVTRGTQAVTPGAAIEPAGASAWGAGGALRPELTGWRVLRIDLPLGGERCADAGLLARELVTAGDGERALRGGRRFTPRLTPAAELAGSPGAGPAGSLPVQLRPDGTYLVAGAFGALGRRVCRLLIQRGARRLIAMGRGKLPPRLAWQALDATAPAAARVRFVQELEALGAEVIAAPVDVTDESALVGWLAGFRALGYPAIRGVFHAAGEVRAAPLSSIDRAAFDAAHDPKVIGAYLLHRHTAADPIDHFVLFSSLAPVLLSALPPGHPAVCPGADQVPAAAGSAFLDALAHHRRSAGLPALCLLGGVLGDDRAQVAAAVDGPALPASTPAAPRLPAGIAGDAPAGPEATPGATTEAAGEARVRRDEHGFALTRNQTALWVVHQLDPDSCPYHIGRVVAVRARLEPELVFAAVRILIRRHPMLRAHIALRDGRPVHRIAPDVTADVKLIDVRSWTWVDIHAALLREYRRPFDLERGPLFRFRLFQRSDRRFLAMQLAHRIVSDGASMAMFLDELLAVYDALRRGVDPVLPPASAHFLEFVNWQNRLLAGPEADRMLRYWTEHLPAELPVSSLPTDRPRPDVQTHHGASQWFVLDSDLTARIQTLAHDTGATPFMILLAAYCVLLHRYSGRDDILIGTPVPGRPGDALARTYGCFANALPLHVSLAGAPSFLELLDRVRDTVLGALDHADYPLARLVEDLGLPHDPSRSAVFQVMFVLHDDRAKAQHHGAALDRIDLPEQDGPLDLTLSVREDEPEHALRCALIYNRDLFDAETVRRMASHYTRLMTAALADPRRPVATLRMLGSAERARIVQRWSGADVAVVPDRPVHAMIRRHAALRPDALAVIAPGDGGARILSYGELDAAASQLARRLRQAGAVAGDVVAVCTGRSPELVIWLLAILQAGAAYLVVDPEDPDERIAAMIERARARFVVGAVAGRLAELPGCTRLAVEAAPGANGAAGDPAGPAGDPAGAAGDPVPAALAALDRTACMFCTPGPAGELRAVAVTHHGLASAYHAWDVTYRLRSEARVHLQTARAALDRFTGDLVRALCSGGALCLVGEPVVRDIARLYETLVHHAVDTAELTPALARELAAYCLREGKRLDFLRLAVVGPGVWKVEDDRQLRALLGRRSRLLHVHGVTEATIDSAYFEGPVDGLEPDQQVPIGGPFPGSRLFVLDRHGAPVPAGVAGELWVAGNGVSAGYLGDRDASAARFMTVELDDRGAMRLFRTGELARWDARGTLHVAPAADPAREA